MRNTVWYLHQFFFHFRKGNPNANSGIGFSVKPLIVLVDFLLALILYIRYWRPDIAFLKDNCVAERRSISCHDKYKLGSAVAEKNALAPDVSIKLHHCSEDRNCRPDRHCSLYHSLVCPSVTRQVGQSNFVRLSRGNNCINNHIACQCHL